MKRMLPLNAHQSQAVALLALTSATLLTIGAGCDTPYTRRVKELDSLYEQGLAREDYMRFHHEAESWDKRR